MSRLSPPQFPSTEEEIGGLKNDIENLKALKSILDRVEEEMKILPGDGHGVTFLLESDKDFPSYGDKIAEFREYLETMKDMFHGRESVHQARKTEREKAEQVQRHIQRDQQIIFPLICVLQGANIGSLLYDEEDGKGRMPCDKLARNSIETCIENLQMWVMRSSSRLVKAMDESVVDPECNDNPSLEMIKKVGTAVQSILTRYKNLESMRLSAKDPNHPLYCLNSDTEIIEEFYSEDEGDSDSDSEDEDGMGSF